MRTSAPAGTAPGRRVSPQRATRPEARAGQHALLDHLVRLEEDRLRDRQTERSRGLEVDDELERLRLLKGEVTGLGAFQDPVDVACGAAEQVRHVRRIGHEAASFHGLSPGEHRRQAVLYRELHDNGSIRGREWAYVR